MFETIVRATELVYASGMVDDFEVLGIAGRRRKALLSETGPQRLCLHRDLIPSERQEFYDAVLQETLAWLKPAEIISSGASESCPHFLHERLQEDFRIHFPSTFALLGDEARSMLELYFAEFPWQGLLLTDHFRYFAPFLRQQRAPLETTLTAQHEWLIAHLNFNDFGEARPDPGFLSLNPTLQILTVARSVGVFEEGLYVYWRDLQTLEVLQHRLDVDEAHLLDLLGEERKFRRAQLLDQLTLDSDVLGEGSSEFKMAELKEKLSKFIHRGIILDN